MTEEKPNRNRQAGAGKAESCFFFFRVPSKACLTTPGENCLLGMDRPVSLHEFDNRHNHTSSGHAGDGKMEICAGSVIMS